MVATERDLTAERDAEVIPVVKALLKRLAAREDLVLGSRNLVSAEKAALYYQTIYKEDVVPLFLEHNIKMNAIPYVFSLLMQPAQLLNDVVTSSFEMNRDLADAMKYNIADINDLRVKDIDDTLKAGKPKPVDKQA